VSQDQDLQERLRASFIEDAKENFAIAEDQLLKMSRGEVDAESIATLFRAVHSIKGGAGSFGFGLVTETAHGMETCLDEARGGRRPVTPAMVQVLLTGVDLLRRMVEEPAADVTADRVALAQGLKALDADADGPPWVIAFHPPVGLLAVGPDPLKLFSTLAELGPVLIKADAEAVPPLGELSPLECGLRWELTVPGSVSRKAIEEVFDWVDGGWTVERVTATVAPSAAPSPVPGAPAEVLEPAASAPRPSHPTEGGAASTIRVPVDKLDQLMNMVGELVITQSMLGELDASTQLSPARVSQISEGLSQLARNTRMLQESVMRLRSQPLSVVFARLPRIVHDLATQLGKQVSLDISGDATELDKTVLEKLGDPLVHLVRNCVDHGLEVPAARARAGKPEAGHLKVSSYGRGKDIYIEVEDDGAGLDEAAILAKARLQGLVAQDAKLSSDAIAQLIFEPGLSTASVVTNVSGRGVGMDVVRQNVHALGGDLAIRSVPGKGTKFTLRLPLSLAIMEGQLVRVGRRLYVIPLLSIVESIQPDWKNLQPCGHDRAYRMRGELIPVVDLPSNLGMPAGDRSACLMVVVETDRGRLGLLVDELLSQQQVVVKSLETNYGAVTGLAGATILGDGSVSLILEPNGLHTTVPISA
jgi:two-component system, chemotaxis family, sensor kinase CheA